jgi:hypothetical protein
MTEAFPQYWRVREQIYQSIAASCSFDMDRTVWVSLAQSCARQAENYEQMSTSSDPNEALSSPSSAAA